MTSGRSVQRTSVRPGRLAAALFAGVLVLVLAVSGADAMPVYDNLPNKLPANTPSEGFEATSTSQFGNIVELSSSRRGRRNPRVTFTLSDWACQTGGGETCVSAKKSSYTWPITVNLYSAGPGNTLGSLLATQTQTVTIPYRPSASAECATKGKPGEWYDKKSAGCFNGLLTKDAYSFSGLTLPNEVAVGIAYNTQSYGGEPTGVPGPENSLNVGMFAAAPRYGANPRGEELFVSSNWSQMYCGSSATLNIFGPSGVCPAYYEDYLPGIEIQAEK